MLRKDRLNKVIDDIESGALLWEQSAFPHRHLWISESNGNGTDPMPTQMRGCFIGWGAYFYKTEYQEETLIKGMKYFGLTMEQVRYLSDSNRTWDEIKNYINKL